MSSLATDLSPCGTLAPMFPLEFRAEVNHEETRIIGLSSSEDHNDCSMSHFDTVPACDGRTDRRTDGFTIASTADQYQEMKSVIKFDSLFTAASPGRRGSGGELRRFGGRKSSSTNVL